MSNYWAFRISSNQIISSLEKEKEFLEVRVDELVEKVQILDNDLEQARYQIAELIENRHVEVISEGFGERDHPAMPGLGQYLPSFELKTWAIVFLCFRRY